MLTQNRQPEIKKEEKNYEPYSIFKDMKNCRKRRETKIGFLLEEKSDIRWMRKVNI